jgi:hypothetical protein
MTLTPLEQEQECIDRIVSFLYHDDRVAAMSAWDEMVTSQWIGDYRWSFVERLVESALDFALEHPEGEPES